MGIAPASLSMASMSRRSRLTLVGKSRMLLPQQTRHKQFIITDSSDRCAVGIGWRALQGGVTPHSAVCRGTGHCCASAVYKLHVYHVSSPIMSRSSSTFLSTSISQAWEYQNDLEHHQRRLGEIRKRSRRPQYSCSVAGHQGGNRLERSWEIERENLILVQKLASISKRKKVKNR